MTHRQAWLERQALCGLSLPIRCGICDNPFPIGAKVGDQCRKCGQYLVAIWNAALAKAAGVAEDCAREALTSHDKALHMLMAERIRAFALEWNGPDEQTRNEPERPPAPSPSPDPKEVEAMANTMNDEYWAADRSDDTRVGWRAVAVFILRQREERETAHGQQMASTIEHFQEIIARLEKALAEAKRRATSSTSAIPAAELDELEALFAKATQGPWYLIDDGPGLFAIEWARDVAALADSMGESDAKAIAAARTAVPRLIAEVRRLGAELTERQGMVEHWSRAFKQQLDERELWHTACDRGLKREEKLRAELSALKSAQSDHDDAIVGYQTRIATLEMTVKQLKSAHDTILSKIANEATAENAAREADADEIERWKKKAWDAQRELWALKAAQPESAKEVDYTKTCSCGDPKCGFEAEPKASEPPQSPVESNKPV